MCEKFAIGKELEGRLHVRVSQIRNNNHQSGFTAAGDYTEDEVLIMDALHCIVSLRRRDPMQVEAEEIIRRGAQSIRRWDRSQS